MSQHNNIKNNYRNEWNLFVKKDDLHSLKIIYNHYFDIFYRYGKKFQAENHLIEDAIQNIFTNLLNVKYNLHKVNNHHAYLLSSFRNELLHLMKHNKRIDIYSKGSDFIFFAEDDPEEKFIYSETFLRLKTILKDCIDKLTPNQQEVLFMKYDQGLSYEEMSDILKISIESCRTSVYRAIKSIKKDIQTYEKDISSLFYFISSK